MRKRPKWQKAKQPKHRMARATRAKRGAAHDTPHPSRSVFINCTAHDIVLGSRTFEPCGRVARVVEEVADVREIGGVRLERRRLARVINLPDPLPGILYLVSARVRVACPDRTDLASPGYRIDRGDGSTSLQSLVVN
ncbi:MAG: hypothetical protein HY962_07080 [Ignavibacteriae bacterium]|nr:hypothetical protein [Ignavibacteriota bacterium]